MQDLVGLRLAALGGTQIIRNVNYNVDNFSTQVWTACQNPELVRRTNLDRARIETSIGTISEKTTM